MSTLLGILLRKPADHGESIVLVVLQHTLNIIGASVKRIEKALVLVRSNVTEDVINHPGQLLTHPCRGLVGPRRQLGIHRHI